MTENEKHTLKGDGQPIYDAQEVRQGDIVLQRVWQRRLFLTGLVGAVLLAFLLVIWRIF